MVDDDAFDAGAGLASANLEPAHDRRGIRTAEFEHGVLLAVGQLDRAIAGAGAWRAWSRKKWKCTAIRWFEMEQSAHRYW